MNSKFGFTNIRYGPFKIQQHRWHKLYDAADVNLGPGPRRSPIGLLCVREILADLPTRKKCRKPSSVRENLGHGSPRHHAPPPPPPPLHSHLRHHPIDRFHRAEPRSQAPGGRDQLHPLASPLHLSSPLQRHPRLHRLPLLLLRHAQ